MPGYFAGGCAAAICEFGAAGGDAFWREPEHYGAHNDTESWSEGDGNLDGVLVPNVLQRLLKYFGLGEATDHEDVRGVFDLWELEEFLYVVDDFVDDRVK